MGTPRKTYASNGRKLITLHGVPVQLGSYELKPGKLDVPPAIAIEGTVHGTVLLRLVTGEYLEMKFASSPTVVEFDSEEFILQG